MRGNKWYYVPTNVNDYYANDSSLSGIISSFIGKNCEFSSILDSVPSYVDSKTNGCREYKYNHDSQIIVLTNSQFLSFEKPEVWAMHFSEDNLNGIYQRLGLKTTKEDILSMAKARSLFLDYLRP